MWTSESQTSLIHTVNSKVARAMSRDPGSKKQKVEVKKKRGRRGRKE